MAGENLLISYNSQEDIFNQTANQNVPNVQVKETDSIQTVQNFLDASIGGIQGFIENQLNKATDVSKSIKVAVSKQLGIPGLVLNYNVELREAEENGITGYKAIYTAGREVFESSVVSTISGAIGSGLVTALAAGLATAGVAVSAPVVAGAGIVVGVGSAIYATSKYDNSRELNDLVSSHIDNFVNFISENSPINLASTNFNLVNDSSFNIESSSKSLEPNNEYLVISETNGGISVPLDENDKAIFLGKNPTVAVDYINVKGGKGISVDLNAGTTELIGDTSIKDFLGNAIINVNGTQFDDIIIGKEITNQSPIPGRFDNEFTGNQGNDALFGGSGNDILTGAVSLPFEDTNEYEIDVLLGGSGSDTFVLGKEGKVFYSEGNDIDPNPPDFAQLPVGTFITPKDFAVIGDFNFQEGDKIQVVGSSEDYYIRTIKNEGFLEAVESTGLLGESSLNPEAFSITILGKGGELIAVLPYDGLDAFVPSIELQPSNFEFV